MIQREEKLAKGEQGRDPGPKSLDCLSPELSGNAGRVGKSGNRKPICGKSHTDKDKAEVLSFYSRIKAGLRYSGGTLDV